MKSSPNERLFELAQLRLKGAEAALAALQPKLANASREAEDADRHRAEVDERLRNGLTSDRLASSLPRASNLARLQKFREICDSKSRDAAQRLAVILDDERTCLDRIGEIQGRIIRLEEMLKIERRNVVRRRTSRIEEQALEAHQSRRATMAYGSAP